MASMIEPLAPDEESRLLKTLSPNGTPKDFIEVHLTRVHGTPRIEFRQMRPDRRGNPVKGRSLYLTLENWDEARGIDGEMPEIEES